MVDQVCVATVFLATLALSRSAPCATLVESGVAKAVIVIPAGQKSRGAEELQDYVERASGAKLSIVAEDRLGERSEDGCRIFVGPCVAAGRIVDLQNLQPEGFVIKTDGDDLFIVGRDMTEAGLPVEGTFYGICEFLERFVGVRWLMAGPLGEVIPRQATIRVAEVDIRQEPLLWQRKIRNSKMGGHVERVEQILEQWDVPLEEWRATFSREQTSPWFDHQRLGSRVRLSYGHSYAGWWKEYHEEHPDIFAMQPDGTRVNTDTRERLCVSNPVLWDLVAKDRIEQLRENPMLTAVSISPNDGGANKFCCCEGCRGWDSPRAQEIYRKNPGIEQGRDLSLSDRYFRFYNEVARRVKQELPDRYLGCYAYSLYREPPVVLDRLEDNLIVGYVGFSTYIDDQTRRANREEWLRWNKLARQLILRPNLLWGPVGLPINYVHRLSEDMRFLADHGMRATDFDGGIGNWGTQGLNYYVLARLLWDPCQDVDGIVNDYCRAAYGSGAEAMEEYYRRLEELTNQIASEPRLDRDLRGADMNQLADCYTDKRLADLNDCVRQARDAIGSTDPAALERVKMVVTGLEYAEKTRDLLAAAAAVREGREDRGQFQKMETEVLDFYRTLALSWAVSVDHNFSYIRRGLGLKPRSAQ